MVYTLKKWKTLKGKYFKLKYDIEDHFSAALQKGTHSMKTEQSRWIINETLKLEAFQKANIIAAFFPLPNEPQIEPFKKNYAMKTFIARVSSETEMDFVMISDLEKDLVKGAFGILEPAQISLLGINPLIYSLSLAFVFQEMAVE